MYTIYALYNPEHDKIYIGQTNDLDQRLFLHKEKAFRKSYTSRLSGTWNLIYTEQVASRNEALAREKQLKSYRGREFIRRHIPR